MHFGNSSCFVSIQSKTQRQFSLPVKEKESALNILQWVYGVMQTQWLSFCQDAVQTRQPAMIQCGQLLQMMDLNQLNGMHTNGRKMLVCVSVDGRSCCYAGHVLLLHRTSEELLVRAEGGCEHWRASPQCCRPHPAVCRPVFPGTYSRRTTPMNISYELSSPWLSQCFHKACILQSSCT